MEIDTNQYHTQFTLHHTLQITETRLELKIERNYNDAEATLHNFFESKLGTSTISNLHTHLHKFTCKKLAMDILSERMSRMSKCNLYEQILFYFPNHYTDTQLSCKEIPTQLG